jgi:hypothetical protein
VTLPPSSATKIPVSTTFDLIPNRIAGLTVGDPVLRTGNPLSVELGPGKINSFICDCEINGA